MSLKAYFNSDRLIFEKLNDLPCAKSLWIPYSSSDENEKDGIDITDAKTGVCFRVTLNENCPFFQLLIGEHKQDWRRKLLQSIYVFQALYNNLQKTIDCFEKNKHHVLLRTKINKNNIQEVAGNVTQLIVNTRLAFHNKLYGLYFFPKEGSEQSHCFFNLKGPKIILGKGRERTFKVCCDSFSGRLGAKGIKKNPDEGSMNREMKILLALRNKTGIIHTYACTYFDNKYVLFHPHYSHNLLNALKDPEFLLTADDKLTIAEQLLKGLTEIAERGTHYDLKLDNIVIARRDTKIDCAITDFEHFYPYHLLASLSFCDVELPAPEWAHKESLRQEYDVWRMGLIFYQLFAGKEPPGMKLKHEDLHQYLLSLKTGWLDTKDLPPKIGELITKMTEPDRIKRINAEDTLKFFQSECISLSK